MLDFTILADDASAYLRLYNGFAVDSGMTAVGSLLRERGRSVEPAGKVCGRDLGEPLTYGQAEPARRDG